LLDSGGGAPSRHHLGAVADQDDLWLGEHARPSSLDLTVQLRPQLDIAKGEPRIPRARTHCPHQLRIYLGPSTPDVADLEGLVMVRGAVESNRGPVKENSDGASPWADESI
jgi:hypothetical protein